MTIYVLGEVAGEIPSFWYVSRPFLCARGVAVRLRLTIDSQQPQLQRSQPPPLPSDTCTQQDTSLVMRTTLGTPAVKSSYYRVICLEYGLMSRHTYRILQLQTGLLSSLG